MKKLFSLVLTMFTFGATSSMAQDFTVLTTPEDILAHSTEDVAGAKDYLRNVISSGATEEEITAATQAYMKNATPAPSYAFDMTFQLIYPAVTESVTMAELAKGWSCDVGGVSDIRFGNNATAGPYLRVNDATKFMEDAAMDTYLLYQKPELNKGKYMVCVDAYAQSNGKAVTLSAGETNGPLIANASKLAPYSLIFDVKESGVTKIGAKRNSATFDWTKSALKTVAFNNMKLYKMSPIIVMKDDATEGLSAAKGVDVQLQKTFSKDKYYAICLPFIVENWRDVFDDLLLWNDATETSLNFNTVSGSDTQARKPYLVKVKEDITAENYLTFSNVTVTKGDAGSWAKDGNNFTMKGNWGAMTLTGNTYYLNDDKFSKAASTAIPAFSAYMETTGEASLADMAMTINGVSTGIKASEVFNDANAKVDVWSIDGKLLKRGVSKSNALNGLSKGVYIINGKKIVL